MNVSQNPKGNNSPRIIKKRLSQEQVRLLEASFDATSKLEPERKFRLARELGVPPRQVAIWYQNKRARWRNQSLELDYGALQVRLEAALADKERLERELEGLRGELKRAREVLFGFGRVEGHAQAPQQLARAEPGQQSSCGDEGAGSSSLNHDNVGGSGEWVSGEGLQFEELYACLLVGSDEW